MNGSTRGQSAGGKERCLFESHGLLRPQSLFESILSSLPAGFQFRQQRLPLGTERPVTLPAVITNGVACEAGLFDQRQRPRGRGLVNTESFSQLRCGQVWDRVEKLQRRKLRGMEARVGKHVLVDHGYGAGDLSHSSAVTRERHQFHGRYSTCIYMRGQDVTHSALQGPYWLEHPAEVELEADQVFRNSAQPAPWAPSRLSR